MMIQKILPYAAQSPELEFLLSLAVGKAQAIPDDLNWPEFSRLVEKSRMEPLLAARIRKLPQWADCPVLAGLARRSSEFAILAMGQITALAEIMALFQRADIRALSLKGPALAMSLYGNPALRFSRDLDVWVEQSALENACALLSRNGWMQEDIPAKTPKQKKLFLQRSKHITFQKNNVLLELHWKISFREDALGFEDFWAARRQMTLAGVSIPCMEETQDAAYQLAHSMEHGCERMRWVVDLYYLLQKQAAAALWEKGNPTTLHYLCALLLLDRTKILALSPVCLPDFSVTAEADGVHISYAPSLSALFSQAEALAFFCEEFMAADLSPLLERAGHIRLDSILEPNPTRATLTVIRHRLIPNQEQWQMVTLPDWLYFLYYPLRWFTGLRRTMSALFHNRTNTGKGC